MTSIFSLFNVTNHLDNVLLVIAISTIFCYLWSYTKSYRQNPPLPPGPWGLPIVGNLPFLQPELHTYFQKMSKKHGPIFRLKLGAKLAIVVTSSEVAHEILRTNGVIFANHDVPAVSLINMYGGKDLVWSPYGPKWRMLRKLCVTRVLSNTVLDSSIELRRQETRRTVAYLADRARDMVLGGTDTSLHVIEFAMAELLNNPEIMKRAQQELEEVVGKDKAVEESHIPKLPYILAIMKETLRLHTVGPLLVPRLSGQTTVVGGFTIPKNTKVFINEWAIHRNPDVWENPLTFDPERFLYKSYDFNGNDLNYIPFGSGRRMCVGMAMGQRVVLYNIATFLHSFDWKLSHGGKIEVEEKFGIVLKLKNPLIVTPMLRLTDPDLYL